MTGTGCLVVKWLLPLQWKHMGLDFVLGHGMWHLFAGMAIMVSGFFSGTLVYLGSAYCSPIQWGFKVLDSALVSGTLFFLCMWCLFTGPAALPYSLSCCHHVKHLFPPPPYIALGERRRTMSHGQHQDWQSLNGDVLSQMPLLSHARSFLTRQADDIELCRAMFTLWRLQDDILMQSWCVDDLFLWKMYLNQLSYLYIK